MTRAEAMDATDGTDVTGVATEAPAVTAGARRLYNSAVVAYAVSAAMELGLLDEFRHIRHRTRARR
jgi:hypothetical protein